MKHIIKTGLAVVTISLWLSTNVLAGEFEDGLAAAQRGDYATAHRLWLPFAVLGNASAQHNLGIMYNKGQGVPQDYAEAVKWYRKAAEQGVAKAQYNLGIMYDKGQGVPRDYAEAVKWYRRAAEQGVAVAQYGLGVMYYKGHGIPLDYVQAHKWLNLAAATFTDKTEREKAASNLDLMAGKMPPAQVAEAQKLAREWKQKGSASGK